MPIKKESYPLFSHEYFMSKALQLAVEAGEKGEVPVGAIVVAEGKRIIGKGSNQTEQLQDVTAHAEILAITAASQYLGGKYLKDCTLYVTIEPCVMCSGALSWSQISKVVIGARDEQRGFINKHLSLHSKTEIITGIMETECSSIVKDFFKSKR